MFTLALAIAILPAVALGYIFLSELIRSEHPDEVRENRNDCLFVAALIAAGSAVIALPFGLAWMLLAMVPGAIIAATAMVISPMVRAG